MKIYTNSYNFKFREHTTPQNLIFMPSQKITHPFLVSIIQGIWKNSGNLIHFYFIYWQLKSAYDNSYTLEQFLYYSIKNYTWFIPSMIAFFIFRFWVDNYSRSFLNKIFKK